MRQVPTSVSQFVLIFPFFLIIVIDVMSANITAPVLAYAVQHPELKIFSLHADAHQRHILFGWLKSAMPFCNVLGTLILGYYSDQFGRRKILIACVVGTLLGLLGYLISFTLANFTILMIASMIIGFTSGGAAAAQAAMADISTIEEKANNISMIALALTLGFVISSALGGVLADDTVVSWFNKKTPIYFAALLSFISLLIAVFFLRETYTKAAKPMTNLWQSGAHFAKTSYHIIFKSNIFFILLVFFLFELGWGVYFNSISLTLVQSFAVKQQMAGLFLSYVGIIMSLGLFYGVRLLTHRYQLTVMLWPALLIGAIAMIIGFSVRTMWVQWLIAIPIALIVALAYSSLIAMASNKIDQSNQGALMSMTDALLSLAFVVDGYLIGSTTTHDALLPQLIGTLFFCGALFIYPFAKKQYLRS